MRQHDAVEAGAEPGWLASVFLAGSAREPWKELEPACVGGFAEVSKLWDLPGLRHTKLKRRRRDASTNDATSLITIYCFHFWAA